MGKLVCRQPVCTIC